MNIPNNLIEVPELNTERLLLRKIRREDAEDIFEYASNPLVTIYMPWETHKTIEDTYDFIRMSGDLFIASDNIDWAVEIKTEQKMIGAISIRKWNDQNRCADVGYVLSRKYWNNGIITEALKAVIEFCFTKLELNRVEAHCDENNIGSWRAMEKAGMRYEGTLRQKIFLKEKFINMKFYSILREEFFNG